jgi:hypothetical protein
MDIIIQIEMLLLSFLFGIYFFFVSYYNLLLIKKLSKIKQFIFNFLLVMDNVFLYLILLYKVTLGAFHIYFGFMLLIGYIIGYYIRKVDVKELFKKLFTYRHSVKIKMNRVK